MGLTPPVSVLHTPLFTLKGNHESATMNQMYGFEGEVKSKYTPQMAELFTEVFNLLPLCHLLNNKVLVSSGCPVTECQEPGLHEQY